MRETFAIPSCLAALPRLALIIGTCALLAGCQLWPFNRQVDNAPPPSDEAPADSSARQAEAASVSIESALNLLQDGQADRAEAMLERISEQRKDDATVRLLLAQIRRPPEELLGDEFENVEVQPGESLSAIAGRTIDNELLFYSLAKLNEIEVPRLLRPGQRLKVPRKAEAPADFVEEVVENTGETPEEASPEGDSPDDPSLEQTARRLVAAERHTQAHALLLSAGRAGKLTESGQALLAQAAVGLSREACRADDPERASKYLNQAEPWLGPADHEAFEQQRAHVNARLKLAQAEQLMARGQPAAAFSAFVEARELDGKLMETHGHKLAQLTSILGEHYHDLALSAWRDQRVDRAVALWRRVVEIDPDFEPAKRYLERARRAQRQLERFEDG